MLVLLLRFDQIIIIILNDVSVVSTTNEVVIGEWVVTDKLTEFNWWNFTPPDVCNHTVSDPTMYALSSSLRTEHATKAFNCQDANSDLRPMIWFKPTPVKAVERFESHRLHYFITWRARLDGDMKDMGLRPEMAMDREKWRCGIIGRTSDPQDTFRTRTC